MPWQPIGYRPAWWFICFARHSPTWWAERFAGRYKHVTAFGFVPGQKLWVFSGLTLTGIELAIVPDGQANAAINTVVADSLVVEYVPPPVGEEPRWFWWPWNHCVAHVAALTGIKSRALRPGGFLKDCLAAGGRILDADAEQEAEHHRRSPSRGPDQGGAGANPADRGGARPA